jgi:hypothetical protein
MREIVVIIALLFLVPPSYSQIKVEPLSLNKFYGSASEKLIYSVVGEYPNVSRAELVKRVKNWAGTAYINAKNVVVSETDDQIVYRYVSNSFVVKSFVGLTSYPWYLRLVIQFKDGKIRAQYFDDGDASSTTGTPLSFIAYFKPNKNGEYYAEKKLDLSLTQFRTSILNSFVDMDKSIRNPKNNDW